MSRFMERAFVWTGGAVFVGSLALTAWTLAVGFARGGPVRLWPLAANGLLLSVFALHHSLFAREPIKLALARAVPERLLRALYVWVASLLLSAVCLLWQPIGGHLYQATPSIAWIFWLIQAGGVWFIAQSVRAIDALELAGIRISNATHASLQSHGVYHVVRHPLYLGWVLIVFGAARMTGDRLAFATMTTAYLLLAIPWEERALERQFGAAYREYATRVRWKIVPLVH